jgi:hypothetical protein
VQLELGITMILLELHAQIVLQEATAKAKQPGWQHVFQDHGITIQIPQPAVFHALMEPSVPAVQRQNFRALSAHGTPTPILALPAFSAKAGPTALEEVL